MNAINRPPIVVVMGHVDHGKTTLLDAIRQTSVAVKEHGGITQSIGAYQIDTPDSDTKKITFIDTPGHQAFTNMRSRGAKVADIAILVVAANDSVMPQTIESIKIIQEAKIPYIVAINKCDLPEANVDKVVNDLLRHNVPLEKYGGDVPWLKISAKTKQGVEELLEMINLIYDLSPIPNHALNPVKAVIIESKMDNQRGPVVSAIILSGTLETGMTVFANGKEFKIRALFDYLQKPLKTALPATPVSIIGLSFVPPVGTFITASVQNETIDQLQPKTIHEKKGQLKLILRADVVGSLEAITNSLPPNVSLIESNVGQITENDIMMAKHTGSIVLGFNVSLPSSVKKLAETEKVFVHTYRIIYELLEELIDVSEGMLKDQEDEILGIAQVLAEFPFEKLRIAGVKITQGRIARGDVVKIYRGDTQVGETKIKTLRVAREEQNKADTGKECGLLFDPQINFTIGDILTAVKRY